MFQLAPMFDVRCVHRPNSNQVDWCLGGSLRIELKAQSRFIGCMSTIIVFMLVPVLSSTNPTPSTSRFPDRLGSGDASSWSARSLMTEEPSQQSTGDAAYVIRRVKVYFQDVYVEELRPTTPFRRPPRVSGKHAKVQIEGLPLERWASLSHYYTRQWLELDRYLRL